nr:site-specific integrase [Magnetospirillum sp. 15-1]
MQRLIDCCPDHLRPIAITAFDTGGRIGNVLGLHWPQVDLERRIVRFLRTKNDTPVSVPMTNRLVAVLSALKTSQDEARKKAEVEPGKVVVPQGDWVFTYQGAPIQCIKTSFAKACERAKIENFRVHDMRHTFASHLVQNGVPLLEVKDLLGHKTLAMVMRYAHLAPDNLRSAVERLPGHNLGIVEQQPRRAAVATD